MLFSAETGLEGTDKHSNADTFPSAGAPVAACFSFVALAFARPIQGAVSSRHGWESKNLPPGKYCAHRAFNLKPMKSPARIIASLV